jgi:hypothetical protein
VVHRWSIGEVLVAEVRSHDAALETRYSEIEA